MARDLIPLANLQSRMATAGRIRLGKKVKGGRPTSISTFRFTSSDRTAIEQLAVLYGGTPQAWADGHGAQWEVETDASEVSIVLPADPLGDSPVYELWSGGGCQRRCDGEQARVYVRVKDDVEERLAECVCRAKDAFECAVKTRLSVILPDIKFAGVWRLDTGSWNAAEELPGMVAMVQQLQQRNLTRALLGIEQRKTGKSHYVVPVIRVDATLDGIASGEAPALGMRTADAPQAPALGTGNPEEQVSQDVVEEVSPDASTTSDDNPHVSTKRKALTRAAHAAIHRYGWDYETQVKHALVSVYESSMSGLSDEQLSKWLEAIDNDESRARFEDHMPYVTEPEPEEVEA